MPSESAAEFLLALGGILLLGLLTDIIGRKTILPRVTLLLLFGMLIGEQGLDLVHGVLAENFEVIADIALVMVGFLLGGKFTGATLRSSARVTFWISVVAVAVTALVVGGGLLLLGVPLAIALLVGCLSSATDPIATVDTSLGDGVRSRFADLLFTVVALDDAWALLIFSVGLAMVDSMNGGAGGTSAVLTSLYEIGGALGLGIALGLPAAFVTGRIRPGEPMLTEALGLVFLCGGLALWLEVSFLLAAMTMGAVIINLARHHDFPFHAIEDIEWPFMVIFFVLAGASLDFRALASIGVVVTAYCLLRAAGKMSGAWLGARLAGSDTATANWMGLAMLPQGGAAIGMALVAANTFPEYRQVILPVVIASTVLFEVLGPVLTRVALRRAGAPAAS